MTQSLHARIASRVAASPNEGKEGSFGAPLGEILALLQTLLTAKYAIEISYRSFADRVRGPWRDALVDHWHEHAKEERESTYQIAMKIMALGGDPIQTNISVPPCTSDVTALCKVLSIQELTAIEACRKLVELAGDNTSLRVLAENTIVQDTQHNDDLIRMCGILWSMATI
jgi:bacterioferritin (cytochrome b1)